MNAQLANLVSAHMRVLVNEIGERPGGSPECRAAEAYIAEQFAKHGWATEMQRFATPAWQDLGTVLRLNERPLPAVANAFSPPCAVSAPAVPVGTLAELQSSELHDRIGVLYGDLLPTPLSPKSWFLKSEREDQIIRLLESKQPSALLTVQRIGGGVERLIEDWEFEIPSATLPAEAGREILRAQDALLDLTIKAQAGQGDTANIMGRSRSDRRRVVLCAHHDTKFGTPGAGDNAGGVAILLALAEILDRGRYPFAVELVSFANEEYLPIGDDEYLRRSGGDDLNDVLACINCDGVGQWTAPDSITAISAGQAFEEVLREVVSDRPDLVWVEPWPESNHSTFSWRGVPSVAFTSTSRVNLAHHPYDDLDWFSTQRAASLLPIIIQILEQLIDKPPGWTRGA